MGLVAAHHLLLGHGLVLDALRGRDEVKWGISLNFTVADPVADEPVHHEAARRIDGLHNRLFLDPVLRGAVPRRRAARHRAPRLAARDPGRRPRADRRADRRAGRELLPRRRGLRDHAAGERPTTTAPAAGRLLAVPGGRVRLGRAPRPAADRHGLGGAARRAAPAARPAARGVRRPDGVRDRVRRGVRRPRSSTAGSTTPSGRRSWTPTCGPCTRRWRRAPTSAACSCGRSSTTSSGPTATTSASASCTSTTTPSSGRPRPARSGTPTSARTTPGSLP